MLKTVGLPKSWSIEVITEGSILPLDTSLGFEDVRGLDERRRTKRPSVSQGL